MSPSAPALTGVWRYNEKESVNAQTGRPELGPQAGGRRPAGAPGAPTRQPQVMGPGANVPNGGNGGGNWRSDPFALTPFAMAEYRGFVRDLLEVPFELTIRVATDSVTFIDDLDRELTFPTDGRKQKFQLSASRFEARARWEGERLFKDIEAAHGFKMREEYFLSQDGRRLFAILRIGEPRKDGPVVGVNRVYDRQQP